MMDFKQEFELRSQPFEVPVNDKALGVKVLEEFRFPSQHDGHPAPQEIDS